MSFSPVIETKLNVWTLAAVLTTSSRLFRPRVSIGPHRITLGKTPLAALPSPNVENSGPWFELGARRFSYAEEHYFGNPGGYLRWAVGMSDAGSPLTPPVGCHGDAWAAEDVAAFRHAARTPGWTTRPSPGSWSATAPRPPCARPAAADSSN